MPSQSRNAQINQFTEQLLRYLLEGKLLEQRQSGQMEYLTKRIQGSLDLENLKKSGDYELLLEKFKNEVSQLPEVRRYDALFAQAEMAGDAEKAKMYAEKRKEAAKKWAKAGLKSILGVEESDLDLLSDAFEAIGEEAGRELYEQAATMKRAKMTKETLEAQLAQQKRKLEEVDIPRTKVQEQKLALEKENVSDYQKIIHERANRIITFLQDTLKGQNDLLDQSGVSPSDLTKLMARISYLEREAQKRKLTPEEEAEIDSAYDIFTLKKTPSAETNQVDRFGFRIGEIRQNEKGEYWQYLGKDIWKRIK